MKIFLKLCAIGLSLTGCVKSIAQQIQSAETKSDLLYPPAKTLDPKLQKTVSIKLDQGHLTMESCHTPVPPAPTKNLAEIKNSVKQP